MSDELYERLSKGYDLIGAKLAQGIVVEDWDRHWIELLREYERLEDEKAAHRAEARPVVQQGMDLGVRVERDVA